MKSTLEEFSRRTGALLLETGILEKRPSWLVVKAGATTLAPYAEPALVELTPEHAIVFILAIANAGSKRDLLLKSLLARVLIELPSDDFIRLLSKFSMTELKDNLLPFIYDSGNRGSVAVFIAAKLRVTLNPEVFQYFLKARTWHQSDLMNLALLVKPEETTALCTHLETIIPSIEPKTAQASFSEFRYIVFNRLAAEVSAPDIAISSTLPAKQPSQILETVAIKAVAMPETKPIAVAPPPPTIVTPAPLKDPPVTPVYSPSKPLNIHLTLPENLHKLARPIGLILTVMVGAIVYLTWYYSEPGSVPTVAAKNSRAPQQWVDSITQRPVTARYLAADRDFRMGELFLTRDKFAEALKLFEDALSIDPDHIQALVRSGFCRMKIGDSKGAADVFRKALDKQPSIESVNLYMARIYAADKKPDLAEKHLRAEYDLRDDLSVGMELANFLAKRGNQNAAMELIASLQEKHPGKMLVLAPEIKLAEEGQRQ